MTQPAEGGTWIAAGMEDRAPEFLRRGKPKAVAVRDARGSATDISPHNPDGSVRFSPFAQDGTLRLDWFARRKINGIYQTVTTSNLGCYGLGAFKEGDGPAMEPKITQDRFMIEQSGQPYDTELTEEVEPFSVTMVDTADPVYQRLRNNLPLYDPNGNALVEDPGWQNAGYGRLLEGGNPGRQFFFLRERFVDGKPVWSVTGVALAKLDDIGNSKQDKKDSEGAKLTYLPLPDGRFMAMQDGQYRPVITYTWWGGSGWTGFGGIPELSASAPVATAGADLDAELEFAVPTGPGDPWTYTVQQSLDAGVTWASAIEPDGVVVAGGDVTLSVTGLSAGASVLRAVVTGTNGASAMTPNSNSVTIVT
jgi:hypothetical protein